MRRRILIVAAVVAGYCAVALVLYRPLNPLDATVLPRGGLGDPVQMSWFLQWTAQAIIHGRNPFETTALDYPLGVNLAVNTLTPALGVLAAPVTLTLGPVAAFNLLLRLAYVASATSMCLVLRRWVRWWPAAIVGGLLYGFGPYALSQGHANAHLVLLFNPLLPWLFALLDDLLVRRRGDPRLVGLLLGLVAGVQVLLDVELLAEAAILVLVAAVLIAARGALTGRWSVVRSGAARLGRAAPPAALVLAAVGGLALYELLFGRRHLNGPVQSLALLGRLRYDLLSAVIPTSEQAVRISSLAGTADRFVGGNLTENGGYLGPVLVAAFVATAWGARRVVVVRMATLLAILAWVLSLGPRLGVDGQTVALPLPGAVFAHLPLLGSVVAARFAVFTDLFVAVVLAVGLDRLYSRLRVRRPPGVPFASGTPPSAPIVAERAATPGASAVPGRISAGPILAGPVLAGPVLGGPVLAGPVLAGLVVAVLVAAGVGSVLPSGRVTERPLGWPAGLAAALQAVVPSGGVVLAYPYPTSPYDSAMGWAAQGGIPFSLVGGYATVPGPPGSHAAQTAPDLLAPASIPELLAFDAAGPLSPYPPPPRLSPATQRRDLRATLRARRVDVVVDWPVGRDPVAATRLLVGTLGPPTSTVGDVLIWKVGTVPAAPARQLTARSRG